MKVETSIGLKKNGSNFDDIFSSKWM